MTLMEPYLNKGYNVTCDNFFTSLQLARELAKKRTTLIGTMRANRREIPTSLIREEKNIPRYSSTFVLTSEDNVS